MIEVESPSEARAVAVGGELILPKLLPVLPLRDSVTYPDTLTPLAVGQERSIQLVNDVLGGNRMLAMVAAKVPEQEEPGPDDIYRVGVAGVVARMLKVPDGTIRILVQGTQPVRLGAADRDHDSSPSRPASIGTVRGRLGGASGSSTISMPSS